MTPKGPDWDAIITDLSRHLASASSLEHVERILTDAEHDLRHLTPPANFWRKLQGAYDLQARRGSEENRAIVSALLGRKCAG